MAVTSNEYFTYDQTNSFSKIVLDYLNGAAPLQPFYHLAPTKENIQKAIAEKSKTAINRKCLVEVLQDTYQTVEISEATKKNIAELLLPNTYTICTAHQPNLFTGHLYFIYKILHTIKLATTLAEEYPEYNFVPVYYMGSEDADLEELGHINWREEKISWKTSQQGAVGRMLIDEALLQLIDRLEGEFATYTFGREIMAMIKKAYQVGTTIQQATLVLVNDLFGKYGLVVLIADDARLKSQMIPVFQNEILTNTSNRIVEKSSAAIAKEYKEQAYSRPINLFYLENNSRERLEKTKDGNFVVLQTGTRFTEKELLETINLHPEKFSPNVILRGLFQETILPNIVFIGGGGELAYWLQLKDLFEHYGVFFPILLLRNSFLLQTTKQQEDFHKMGFSTEHIFQSLLELENQYTVSHSKQLFQTKSTQDSLIELYESLARNASLIDPTLVKHIEALKTKQLHKLTALDKKILRAEKRKHQDALSKIKKIKQQLCPNNSLQERVDNIIPYYATFGTALLDQLLAASLPMQSKFCVHTIA